MPNLSLNRKPPGSRSYVMAVVAALLMALFSANTVLTVASILMLALLVKLLWRPGGPQVLLYAIGFQWLQASILIFYADLQGSPLNALTYFHFVGLERIVSATWLTLIGLLVVALGMWLAAGPRYVPDAQPASAAITAQLSVRRLFFASLAAIVLAGVLKGMAYMVSGLAEPVNGLVLLRWVVVYLLAYTVFVRQRGYQELSIVVGIEITIGFLGFFADFKTVLIVVFLAATAAPDVLGGVRIRTLAAFGVLAIALAVVWSSIKIDYRNFLNQGSRGQVILVSTGDQLAKLANLLGDLTLEQVRTGGETLLARLSYVDYFGAAMDMVPNVIPYEDGKLWGEAIQHVFAPRLFNPSKPAINDSDRTAYYTGVNVARGEEGTSASLGYIAETYIDFGPALMMFPLFLWGLFLGWVYRTLIRSGGYSLFGYACAVAVVFPHASVLEQSNLKLVGGVVVGFLALYLVQKYFARQLLRELAHPVAAGRVRPTN